MPFPFLPVIGAVGAVAGGIWSAREARKNREFQERMSNTAHQREVRDLRSAGLNPVLSANRGASTPSGAQGEAPDIGGGVVRGVATALAVKQQKAQIDLLEAQADRERSAGQLNRIQGADIVSTFSSRVDQMGSAAALSSIDAETRRTLLPALLSRAQEEVRLTAGSARAAEARAVLDEMAASGAANIAEFEKRFGPAGPMLRLFFEMMRSVPGVTRNLPGGRTR